MAADTSTMVISLVRNTFSGVEQYTTASLSLQATNGLHHISYDKSYSPTSMTRRPPSCLISVPIAAERARIRSAISSKVAPMALDLRAGDDHRFSS
jgi:hypothetical protein